MLKRKPEGPLAAIFYYKKEGQREWSVRAREGTLDVNEPAKKFKGGGHKAAAGFRDPEVLPPIVINPKV